MSERLKYYSPLLLSLPLIFAAVWRICEYIPIYYDGSYIIFTNLIAGEITNFDDTSRLLGHILFEGLPVMYSKWSSHPSMQATAYLYSTSSILIPLSLILICWWILPGSKKEYFYYPLMGYAIMTITSLTFDCNELNLGHAMMWVICCLLLRHEKTIGMAVCIFFLATAMAFAYPVFILLVPALMLMIWKHNEWPEMKSFFGLGLVLLLTVYLSAHHNQLMPGTTKSFITAFQEIFDLFTATYAISIFIIFLISIFLRGKFSIIFFAAGSILTSSFFLWQQHNFENWYLYSGRVPGLLITSLLASTMIIFRRRPALFHAAVFVGSSLYATAFYINDWHKVQNEFLTVSQEFTGIVPYERFIQKTRKFQHNCTHWNAEMFSVMIQVMNDKPITMVVRKHPEAPESFLVENEPGKFNEMLESKGVRVSFKRDDSADHQSIGK